MKGHVPHLNSQVDLVDHESWMMIINKLNKQPPSIQGLQLIAGLSTTDSVI